MLKKIALVVTLSLVGCGGPVGAEDPLSLDAQYLKGSVPAPDGYCESTIGGECYMGSWVIKEQECHCHRTFDQCEASCGEGFNVTSWTPFTCGCGR